MKLFDLFLSYIYPRHIATVMSPLNGPIEVELYMGKYRTTVFGYWQSGSYAESIITHLLNHVNLYPRQIHSILILGLGCGSMASRLHDTFPKAIITGVEIDKHMITIGKKYFRLHAIDRMVVKIEDAVKFIQTSKTNSYDIIVSDLFIGCDSPIKTRSPVFIRRIKSLLTKQGLYLCNFSENAKHRSQTDAVVAIMKTLFSKVESFHNYPKGLPVQKELLFGRCRRNFYTC